MATVTQKLASRRARALTLLSAHTSLPYDRKVMYGVGWGNGWNTGERPAKREWRGSYRAGTHLPIPLTAAAAVLALHLTVKSAKKKNLLIPK